MKLILQIALGVFLGSVTAQFSMELYRNQQAAITKVQLEKIKAEQEKKRQEQVKLLRNILIQNQHSSAVPSKKLTDDVIPVDSNTSD